MQVFDSYIFWVMSVVTCSFIAAIVNSFDIHNTTLRITVVTILCTTWWYGFDFDSKSSSTQGYTITKKLVSASPSEKYLDGSFSMFMGTGSGGLETKRYYLVRERIREGLYKDLMIKHEVYIEERESLPKGEGLFEQDYTCKTLDVSYKMLFWKLHKVYKNQCEYSSQRIVVPKGYVIKELRI